MRESSSYDEEESETSTQDFTVAVGPDGVARTIDMTETYADGSTHRVMYEEVPSDDPYVRLRQRIVGENPPSEVSTTFAPSAARPRSYPAGLPFVAERECYTTESPAGTRSVGVRWRCTDPEEVQRAVADALVADGWVGTSLTAMAWFRYSNGGQVFARGSRLRVISRHDFEGGSVIDLADLDGSLLPDDRPKS
ncbi:MAG TPA: hypothetical protein VGM82_23350 [Gemmatimonadaceae bacterium]|jgi:hypothetical protein